MNLKLFKDLLLALILTLGGLFLIYLGYRYTQAMISEKSIFTFYGKIKNDYPKTNVLIHGTWECLPPEYTTENGLECAIGLKTAKGNYYLLFGYAKFAPKKIKRGSIFVTGQPIQTMTGKDGSKVNQFQVKGV